MAISTLAWVTTGDAHGLDEDEPPALAALARAGVTVEVVDWDDPEVDWSAFDRVVLRSAWDYAERLPEFLNWLTRVDSTTALVNPLLAVRWSLDKQYLRELAAAGVPITPPILWLPARHLSFRQGSSSSNRLSVPAVEAPRPTGLRSIRLLLTMSAGCMRVARSSSSNLRRFGRHRRGVAAGLPRW